MKARFCHYNLELEEVLIGTPTAGANDKHIAIILEQLRSRQIAEEQVETYKTQEKAAAKERDLREAMARASTQKQLTESELAITIEANQGKAAYERSIQQAAQKRTMAEAEATEMRLIAEAEATRIRTIGEAEADKAARVGIAEAVAIDEQVRAYGGPKFQVTQQVMKSFAEAIAEAKVDVVPRVVIGGSGNGQGQTGSIAETLLALLLSDKLGDVSDAAPRDTLRRPEIEALRAQLANGSNGKTNGRPVPPPLPKA